MLADEVAPPRSPCSASSDLQAAAGGVARDADAVDAAADDGEIVQLSQAPPASAREGVDERVVVIDAETEPDPPPAAVGQDPRTRRAGARHPRASSRSKARKLPRGRPAGGVSASVGSSARVARPRARRGTGAQPLDVSVDLARGDAEVVQPAHHRVEAVEARRVERRAPEAHRGLAVTHRVTLGTAQSSEVGEPAGVHGPQLAVLAGST